MGTTILSMSEAAAFLGKTPQALRQGYREWEIPHFRVGRQIKFTKESLSEWVDKQITKKETEQ